MEKEKKKFTAKNKTKIFTLWFLLYFRISWKKLLLSFPGFVEGVVGTNIERESVCLIWKSVFPVSESGSIEVCVCVCVCAHPPQQHVATCEEGPHHKWAPKGKSHTHTHTHIQTYTNTCSAMQLQLTMLLLTMKLFRVKRSSLPFCKFRRFCCCQRLLQLQPYFYLFLTACEGF